MERIPEPELMDEPVQALAYAQADFEAPNAAFVALFDERFGPLPASGTAVDLGCGPADIVVRLARRWPGWRFDAVDGAEAMLSHGRDAIEAAGVADRVRLLHAQLPETGLEPAAYDAVLSNSLLHHLPEGCVLWDAVRRLGRPGAPVLVMDLTRPETEAVARRLVDTYAADEPEILRRDFFASLCAAFTPKEVHAQLEAAGLEHLRVERTSDRHLMVSGRL